MLYYKYDFNYRYTGMVESAVPVSSATTVAPLAEDHLLFDPNTNTWGPISTVISLDDLKAIEHKNAISYYDDVIKSVSSDIALFEPDTYQTQENEWRAWLANPDTALTPYVDILSARRGLTRYILTLPGDESTTFAIDGTLTGVSTGAFGTIEDIVYDINNSITKITTKSVIGAYNIGEIVTDGISDSTGTIINITANKDILMNKIGYKVQFFASVQGSLHSDQDSIDNCTTVDELSQLYLPWKT